MELLSQLNGVNIYLSSKPYPDKYTIDPTTSDLDCGNIECTECPFDNPRQVCNVNELVQENKKELFKNHPELLI